MDQDVKALVEEARAYVDAIANKRPVASYGVGYVASLGGLLARLADLLTSEHEARVRAEGERDEASADADRLEGVNEGMFKALEFSMERRLSAERQRDDLLARIHRDGGDYTEEHGVAKSCADAHIAWAALMSERDALSSQVRELKEALVEAALPMEAMLAGGTLAQHSPEVREQVIKALKAIRVLVVEHEQRKVPISATSKEG